MALKLPQGQKKMGKKFKFFKFKGFGSLSSLPRAFTLRRASAPVSPQSRLEPERPFENTQDDLGTVPKSPVAYARSSDMYSHMGTMPRHNSKRGAGGRDPQPCSEQQDTASPAELAPLGYPNAPTLVPASGAEEDIKPLEMNVPPSPPQPPKTSPSMPGQVLAQEAPDLPAKKEKACQPGEEAAEEEGSPQSTSPERVPNGQESGSEYVRFSKEKYILDSSPEKLHKELEEELKLSSTDLRSHAWYHGRIPREVSESLVQRNGDFLIRDSLTSLGDYVLTCRWRHKPLHFKINKVMVKAGESYTHIQYLFEQESFDHVPALVRFYVGSRKAVSEQSGAVIYCPVNRTFPLRYLEASYGLSHGKPGGPSSPSGQKGGHMKRRSITMTDGLTADKVTRAEGCPTSVSLPHHRDAIRNCALSMDQIQDLHLPMSPISESPGSPAYSTVTRLKPSGIPATGVAPASPATRRSSEPQLCPGSNHKPLGEPADSAHSAPGPGYPQASPSPSLNSYSDPDSGHYCQLHPPSPGGRERAGPEPPGRGTKSHVERLKGEEGPRLADGSPSEGHRDGGFTTPLVEAPSSFNPTTFQSLLIPHDNKPLEMSILRRVKELLAEVDTKTLARHITKVDCLVARILGVTKEMQRLMGVSSGMELLTLPHGRQLRLDLLERFHTMSIMLAVDILSSTGATEDRAMLLHKTIQLAAELRNTMGNMFSFAAVMGALDMSQIARLEQTWMMLRQRHTEGAILYEKKLKPFLKSLNEGKEGPPLSNTTFPHVLPLITLLECDAAPPEGPQPWETTDQGVEVVLAHLEAARMVAHHGGLYHTNAEVKLQGFQAHPELLEIFSTEFQMRLLWGSQGAGSNQAKRYEKFDKVLTALSHKVEPPVRSSEL
ncbi:SH2 domain-containing protein 3C isoform X1 [Tachyglossus aculeatus]|uniref:SH2 domain-containing protein 3C isoform X1 n=1 Tax=Tachyglossus aculeatus TaxID=9261 RepID=UPI0018F6413E|nr:SH2 domain-containing protein 3C isoform X1 [Tachyglossus aculeatus]